MDSRALRDTNGEKQRLLDEIEQLRTSLESALDDNSRLTEDRDRLLSRVTVLSRELQAANHAYAHTPPTPPLTEIEREAHQSQTEEELRVAFEELQVLTEELEVANTTLQTANAELEARVAERTRALAQANADLRSSEAAFRTLVEGMPQLAWRSLGGGEWTWSSPQWSDYTGQSPEESRGKGWLDALHPDDRELVMRAWESAGIRGMLDVEHRVRRARDGAYVWHHTRSAPARNEQNRIVEWLGTSTDIHALRELQERQRVLVAELQHRTFNLMGMVRSTADATIRTSASLDEFKVKFRERIEALARVQRLLSRLSDDDRLTFGELIRSELDAAGALQDGHGSVTLDGPEGVGLRSGTVQTFAMALHELTTNAVKYGALKQPGAHLSVWWRVERRGAGQPWLRIEWHETGVVMPPAGAKPQGTGQGRRLIEQALPYQLKAEITYIMADDGVRCSIALPVSARTLAELHHVPR